MDFGAELEQCDGDDADIRVGPSLLFKSSTFGGVLFNLGREAAVKLLAQDLVQQSSLLRLLYGCPISRTC